MIIFTAEKHTYRLDNLKGNEVTKYAQKFKCSQNLHLEQVKGKIILF